MRRYEQFLVHNVQFKTIFSDGKKNLRNSFSTEPGLKNISTIQFFLNACLSFIFIPFDLFFFNYPSGVKVTKLKTKITYPKVPWKLFGCFRYQIKKWNYFILASVAIFVEVYYENECLSKSLVSTVFAPLAYGKSLYNTFCIHW